MVLFVLLGTNITIAMLVYEASARMLAYDPYKTGFGMLMASLLAQQVITACALSVSYGDLRSATSTKEGLTPLEETRVSIVNAYIYVVMVVLLPLGITFLVYALN